eukprot:695189-Rhodomonas_salina.1
MDGSAIRPVEFRSPMSVCKIESDRMVWSNAGIQHHERGTAHHAPRLRLGVGCPCGGSLVYGFDVTLTPGLRGPEMLRRRGSEAQR